jgi:NAD(P)-dependent dehydrogenase (short-subunit alcohol dehydrogenase family)
MKSAKEPMFGDTANTTSSCSRNHALAQSAAVALGRHGVVCAAVAPGFVATRMARLEGPAGAAIAAQSPWGRVATPDEVASSVDFAARFFENAWTSGAVIACNGASHLHS